MSHKTEVQEKRLVHQGIEIDDKDLITVIGGAAAEKPKHQVTVKPDGTIVIVVYR
ncbi:hypothetical protein [Stigmatella aurantiaca]|uniref:Uncharacterized protein n=1 Tax=Stigmatella aurantiaca (strain DW4/3-1) TaxID=378806 RepID=Q093R6_STIAD|nr:hypothetical protein [Stigmatella aurantiaca]EAU66962.1 hypothetical protein STIAU_4625 [Stigmatella aurantiaca DW4/3-1]